MEQILRWKCCNLLAAGIVGDNHATIDPLLFCFIIESFQIYELMAQIDCEDIVDARALYG